jgi:hypothetical protein
VKGSIGDGRGAAEEEPSGGGGATENGLSLANLNFCAAKPVQQIGVRVQ